MNAFTYELDQELGLDAPRGLKFAIGPLRQERVNFIDKDDRWLHDTGAVSYTHLAAKRPETTKVEREGINVVIVLERSSTLETSG